MHHKTKRAWPLVAASFSMLLTLVVAATHVRPVAAQKDVARMSGAGKDIRKFAVADGIFQFMTMRDSYVRQLNSVVIVNQNDVLVFDTNTRPSSARLILAEIRKITDKPVRYVVNSHWHPDHWSGNGRIALVSKRKRSTMTEISPRSVRTTLPVASIMSPRSSKLVSP